MVSQAFSRRFGGFSSCVSQVVALANRPGFPFLGNDFFREMGDCFACHAIQNPDETSEVQLLQHYAPTVAHDVLRLLSQAFGELRQLVEAGVYRV